jgi:hypothetical protein
MMVGQEKARHSGLQSLSAIFLSTPLKMHCCHQSVKITFFRFFYRFNAPVSRVLFAADSTGMLRLTP